MVECGSITHESDIAVSWSVRVIGELADEHPCGDVLREAGDTNFRFMLPAPCRHRVNLEREMARYDDSVLIITIAHLT